MGKIGGEGYSEYTPSPELRREMKNLHWDPDDPDQVRYYIEKVQLEFQNVDFTHLQHVAPVNISVTYPHTPATDQRQIEDEYKFHSTEISEHGRNKTTGRAAQPTRVTTTSALTGVPKKPDTKPSY